MFISKQEREALWEALAAFEDEIELLISAVEGMSKMIDDIFTALKERD
jgi:hypothetical protein